MHLQVLNGLHRSNTMTSNPLFDSSMSYKATRPPTTDGSAHPHPHNGAEPAYRQEISLIVTGFVRRRSSKPETQDQNTAQSIEWSQANDMVTEMDDDGDIYVTSFGEDEQEDEDSTFIETDYTVALNPTDSSVISTRDCPDFVRHMFPCKHMWPAARGSLH
ncbi:BQ5605_C001g00010 [Microbotryum silenes-dioicae]|uniref:BQ5605_C001g00010 protein n=1 Tax=Microbotryum silenes-dioicae TaxID=796604 RepID=A0A2X0M218_9BASI|nr:BQ5605_C001g00010 [Microbotryum silenes-dioicae]